MRRESHPASLVNRTRRTGGLIAAGTLTAAAVVHLYWLVGGRTGSTTVIPTTDGRPTLHPGPIATAGVAAALAIAAALYAGASLQRPPHWLYRIGTLGVAGVLTARAIGDRRSLGLLKTNHGSAFARLDTTVLSPLCAALAITGIAAATT